MYENEEMQLLMEKSNLILALRATSSASFYSLYANGLRVIERQQVFLWMNLGTMPYLVITTYLSAVYFNSGMIGLCIAQFAILGSFSMILRPMVMLYDWGLIEQGEKETKNSMISGLSLEQIEG
jgi:hypothetical protein